MSTFWSELQKNIEASLRNNFTIEHIPNISYALQYRPEKKTLKHAPREFFRSLRLPLRITNNAKIKYLTKKLDIKGLSATYEYLDDQYSRNMLVQLVTYRILGPTKVKLPLSGSASWEAMNEIKSRCLTDGSLQTDRDNLALFDLAAIGSSIKYFVYPESIFVNHYLKQYEYKNCNVSKGDYVIDGGACFGDTAIQFAEMTGDLGKVYSFEFEKKNIAVFNKNLDLNPQLNSRINIVPNALWSNSNESLYVVESGAASKIVDGKSEEYSYAVTSKSIDDFVESEKIPKIDFIKLDIEGAEYECVVGASNTIKKYRPKLAICLYHDIKHFVSIPKLVKELVPDYKLYLSHFSADRGETVMFAVPKT